MSQQINITEITERLTKVRDSLTELSLLLSDYHASLVLSNGGDSVKETDALMKKLICDFYAAPTAEQGKPHE